MNPNIENNPRPDEVLAPQGDLLANQERKS